MKCSKFLKPAMKVAVSLKIMYVRMHGTESFSFHSRTDFIWFRFNMHEHVSMYVVTLGLP